MSDTNSTRTADVHAGAAANAKNTVVNKIVNADTANTGGTPKGKTGKTAEKPGNADIWNQLLVDYCPDAVNQMQFHTLRLTPEQRREILEIVRRNSTRKPRLSEYCTPLNSCWIFAAIDSVIGNMEESREIDVMEPRLLYPFFLSLELEAASVMTPATLLYRLKTLVNAVYDVMPGFWDAIQWAAIIQEGMSDSDYSVADAKAEAINEGQARLDECIQSIAVE